MQGRRSMNFISGPVGPADRTEHALCPLPAAAPEVQLRCRPRSVKKFCEISRGAWTSGPCTVDRVTLALILRMGPTPLNKPRRVASTLRLHGRRDVLTTSPRPSLLQPRGAIGAPRAYFVFACTVESVPSFPPHGPPEVPSERPDRL